MKISVKSLAPTMIYLESLFPNASGNGEHRWVLIVSADVVSVLKFDAKWCFFRGSGVYGFAGLAFWRLPVGMFPELFWMDRNKSACKAMPDERINTLDE